MDKPETLATLGTQKHGTKTSQRHWQHWAHKNTGRRQARDTGNIGHTKTRDENNKQNTITPQNTEN